MTCGMRQNIVSFFLVIDVWQSEEGKEGLKKWLAKAFAMSTGDLIMLPSTSIEERLLLQVSFLAR
jgi:hypothetical protein